MSIMGAPRNMRLPADFDQWYPQGLYLVGEITAVTEYQSPEDKARNRGTFAYPSAEKDREKAVTVEFACAHQPVPPEQVAGMPFRPVVLEGMTVQPRVVGRTLVFAPPKGGNKRRVPLSSGVLAAILAHKKGFPSTEVTLCWDEPDRRCVRPEVR
jgi:hypothetical protein